MKIILMSLTLFTPVASALAEATDEDNTLHKTQRPYPGFFENVQPQPEPVYDEQPRYLKLIQPIEDEQRIRTFRT